MEEPKPNPKPVAKKDVPYRIGMGTRLLEILKALFQATFGRKHKNNLPVRNFMN